MDQLSKPSGTDGISIRQWILVLSFTFVVRAAVLLAMRQGLEADPDGYRTLAVTLNRTGVYGTRTNEHDVVPSAFRPPAYPFLLSLLVAGGQLSNVSVGVLHLILGIATVALVLDTSRKWGLGGSSILAALLVACDPILLNQSTLVMTETLASFLSAVALWCLTPIVPENTSPQRQRGRSLERQRGRSAEDDFPDVPSLALRAGDASATSKAALGALAAGAVMGLAVLCRPTFLIWLLLVAAAIPFVAKPRWTVSLVAVALGATIVLAPWTIRNYLLLGRPTVATTHGGYTLLLGNNQQYYEHLRRDPWGSIWDSREFDDAWVADHPGKTEVELDGLAYEQAVKAIRRWPAMFAYACSVRVVRLWNVLPHQLERPESLARRWLRYAVAGWYIPVLGLAIAGVLQLRRRLLREPWLWGMLLCLSFTMVHLFYWTNMRMRAPLMPVIAMLAAACIGRLRSEGTTH